MNDCTIIVPIYKGNQYIDGIIELAKKNECKLILINDDPDTSIEIKSNEFTEVRIIEHNSNQGIHVSRVDGVLACNTDYILMLDQDDIISDNYINSQLRHIGHNDAVVCNGKLDGIPIYRDEISLKCTGDNNVYRSGRNPIVSPGQVLLKKDKIPLEWLNYTLKNNGADDYLLWILMLEKKCKFAFNNSTLYIHRTTGNNTSLEVDSMRNSIMEALTYLQKMNIWDEDIINVAKEGFELDKKALKNKDYDKAVTLYRILDKWLELRDMGYSPSTYCSVYGYRKIVVYGVGILGRHLTYEIRQSDIEIVGFFDKKYPDGTLGLKKLTFEDSLKEVDLIVVTPIMEKDNIISKLKEQYDIPIVSVTTLINYMGADLDY